MAFLIARATDDRRPADPDVRPRRPLPSFAVSDPPRPTPHPPPLPSRSRSRSPADAPPARRPRRRPTGFDVPPPGETGVRLPNGGIGPDPEVYAAQKAAAAAAAAAGDPGSNAPGSAAAPTGAARVNASLDVGAQMTRHARRIYVGALPPVADNLSVAVFFGDALRAIGGVSASADAAGEPVLNAYVNMEKKFAFVEFRNVEECSNALALDGVVMDGQSLRVRRPNDYDPAAAAGLGPTQPSPSLNLAAVGIIRSAIGGAPGSGGALSPEDQNNPNRLFIGGLPYFLTEQMTRELVEAFGPTRSFQLVIDRDTGKSKGYGFFIYQDESVTDVACQGLHGMQMGDKTLTVQRAAAGASKPAPAAGANATAAGAAPPGLDAASLQAQAAAHLAGIGNPGGSVAVPPPPPPPPAANPASRAVSLAEMLEVDELRDDEEFADILEDMREECGKFGEVAEIVIPRPDAEGGEAPAGLGKVFVLYADVAGAAAARDALHGRKFGGKTVVADFLDPEAFAKRDF